MNVLVTGGAGFLGAHLVAALTERGDAVRVVDRPSRGAEQRLAALDVEFFAGDIREPESLKKPMNGVDAVVHLAAMSAVWAPMHEYHAVNVTGTENVCRAALAAGVTRLVHISSWTVYGMGIGRPATEDSRLAPLNEPYSVTKALGDRLVQRLIAEDGLPATIIRPDTIFGPGDRVHVGRMSDRLRAGRSIIVGSGQNAMPFIYVADIVQGLLLALDRPEAVGQAYNLANDEPLTQEELLRALAEEIGATPPRIRVPYGALYAAGYLAEHAARLVRARHKPILTRLGVAIFGADNRHAIGKARRELGYSPAVPVREGIRRAATWYRQESIGSQPALAAAGA
ncbi:MAG TPA: NAD-dependent epimerase/dehydratase family protein [Thermoleophilaceae bacterium]|nr:NAD-dependent epimerase/dehydratase family protein [Thermoleophilaceae bacterium]